MVVCPSQDGVRGQLGALVADDGRGLAVGDHEPVQFAGHSDAADRGVGNQRRSISMWRAPGHRKILLQNGPAGLPQSSPDAHTNALGTED